MANVVRRRFILTATLVLVGILALLMGGINVFNYMEQTRRADQIVEVIHTYEGVVPDPEQVLAGPPVEVNLTTESPFATRYLIARADGDGVVEEIDIDHIAAFDDRAAIEQVEEILARDKASGYAGQYRYGVFPEETGCTVIVLDYSAQLESVSSVLRITLLASLALVALGFCLLLPLSKRAVRPFVENMERQRQFITDASHELKTPLTVIAANTDVLELTTGENQWTKSIRGQLLRLNHLVHSMSALAREEERAGEGFAPVDLSALAEDMAAAYAPALEGQGIPLTTEIVPGIEVSGDRDALNGLLSILLDNAVKYVLPGGRVHLDLQPRGGGALLEVRNTADPLRPEQLRRLFDRFYRADTARSRESGGHGIGLSVARAVAERHGGKISARCEYGEIIFSVHL